MELIKPVESSAIATYRFISQIFESSTISSSERFIPESIVNARVPVSSSPFSEVRLLKCDNGEIFPEVGVWVPSGARNQDPSTSEYVPFESIKSVHDSFDA
jgi:hypothetical protein